MKLYATTTTERASKGQGGNKRLEITVQGGEYRDILARFEVKNNEENAKKYGQIPYTVNIVDGERLFLVHLKSKIAFYLDQTEKGEKQKGESVEVLSGSEYMVKNDKGEEVIFESVIPKSLSI